LPKFRKNPKTHAEHGKVFNWQLQEKIRQTTAPRAWPNVERNDGRSPSGFSDSDARRARDKIEPLFESTALNRGCEQLAVDKEEKF
jgi:hypothetical protein